MISEPKINLKGDFARGENEREKGEKSVPDKVDESQGDKPRKAFALSCLFIPNSFNKK